MNGADALIRTFAECGVRTCFANPGTSEMHLVAALDREPRIRSILCLFEGVATGAADGYARMTGRPAMTLLHLGPGYLNGAANLHNARRAFAPTINVIGDHATYHRAPRCAAHLRHRGAGEAARGVDGCRDSGSGCRPEGRRRLCRKPRSTRRQCVFAPAGGCGVERGRCARQTPCLAGGGTTEEPRDRRARDQGGEEARDSRQRRCARRARPHARRAAARGRCAGPQRHVRHAPAPRRRTFCAAAPAVLRRAGARDAAGRRSARHRRHEAPGRVLRLSGQAERAHAGGRDPPEPRRPGDFFRRGARGARRDAARTGAGQVSRSVETRRAQRPAHAGDRRLHACTSPARGLHHRRRQRYGRTRALPGDRGRGFARLALPYRRRDRPGAADVDRRRGRRAGTESHRALRRRRGDVHGAVALDDGARGARHHRSSSSPTASIAS